MAPGVAVSLAGPADLPDAQHGSGNEFQGVDYDKINKAVDSFFSDPALNNSLQTRAVVVLYKVQATSQVSSPHTLLHCLVSLWLL